MKRCTDCLADKPMEQFPPSKTNKDGRGTYCRPCLRVREAGYRDRAPGGPPRRPRTVAEGFRWCPRCERACPLEAFGRNRAAANGLTAYCKPCHNLTSRENRERLHGSTRNYHLTARYGLTAVQVDELVAAQGGLCAICRKRAPGHVDHDHETGRVRGVLCSGCNQGLGNFRDDTAALRAAIDYLETS